MLQTRAHGQLYQNFRDFEERQNFLYKWQQRMNFSKLFNVINSVINGVFYDVLYNVNLYIIQYVIINVFYDKIHGLINEVSQI